MKKIKCFFYKIYNSIKKRFNEISIITYIKTNILFISYVLFNLINSCLLRVITIGDIFSFKGIISDLAFILSFGAFAYLVKPKKQIRVLMPITIVMMLICIVNAVYYENYVSFASFSLLSTASFLGEMDGNIVTGLIQFKDVMLIFPPFFFTNGSFIFKEEKLLYQSRKN